MKRSLLATRERCATLLAERIGTVRALAAAAAAWSAVAAAGIPVLVAALACVSAGTALTGTALVVRAQSSAGRAALVGSLLCAIGMPALLAGAHALSRAEAPRPVDVVVQVVADPQETESGRWRTVGTGEFGRATLVADEPPPEAGSTVRAKLDWWADDLAGIDDVEVVGSPSSRWQVRSALRAGLSYAAGVGAHAGADLLPGLVIGDVAHLDAGLADAMRTVSLTHLTAVSGETSLNRGGCA